MSLNTKKDELLSFTKNLIPKAQKRRLVLPESADPRVIKAAAYLVDNDLVKEVILCGDRLAISQMAAANGTPLAAQDSRWTTIREAYPNIEADLEACLNQADEKALAAGKKPAAEPPAARAASPLYQAGFLLQQGMAEAAVAGSIATTANVIRAAIKTVGLDPATKTLSGAFILEKNTQRFLFADAAIIIEPDVSQLVTIAASSVATWQRLFPQQEPAVAFLSFATKGSADHPSAQKMADAAAAFKKLHPQIIADGEFQFDAALDASIGAAKAPESVLPGKANILIFPNLDAGNIAYKVAQRLGGYRAYGPLLQGSRLPYFDLSRGTTWQDIVTTSLIAIGLGGEIHRLP